MGGDWQMRRQEGGCTPSDDFHFLCNIDDEHIFETTGRVMGQAFEEHGKGNQR